MGHLNLPRLIYLAVEHKPVMPGKLIAKSLPQGDLLSSVAIRGIKGAAADLDINEDQIRHLYELGSKPDRGSVLEFKTLVGQVLMSELELHRDEMPMGDYLVRMREVANYVDQTDTALSTREEADLGVENKINHVVKWESGFSPIDLLIGGFYSSITTLIARPGHGKTSIMLSLMEGLRKDNAASSIWMYELEIPLHLMLYRASSCLSRVKFISGMDRLVCGPVTMTDIETEVDAHPDPNRVIIIDSPDVMAAGAGEGKRFKIEDIYISLIRLKSKCKAVIVTSWPRRKDGGNITMDSVAESWSKAWYSDIMIGMTKLGRAPGGENLNNVKLVVVKNRFGDSDRELTFQYNYVDLSWQLPANALAEIQGDDW